MEIERDRLIRETHKRLVAVMTQRDVPAVLTANPINILYATGARNMTVFSLMGPFRFALILASGEVILWEFAGCEHLQTDNPVATDIRAAPGISAISGPGYRSEIDCFVRDVRSAMGAETRLATEGFDLPVIDVLRENGLELEDATDVFSTARLIKQPLEISVMREAVSRVEAAARSLEAAITPDASEVEVWSEFHRHLIATEGEYVSTRLFQSGNRTFPYFQEAGPRRMQSGDLVCFDTDALGYLHYAVDFSRTFLCGDRAASLRQKDLYSLAHDQLHHNAMLLGPGVSYEEFARAAWPIPAEYRGHGYYCLGHGLGLCGEFPYVPHYFDGVPYVFEGCFEPGMVICIESYIGAEAGSEGVKLEDQYLITETGAERMTTYPFCEALLA
ncbi:Xaa-Pro peptidase family protein [Labrenzia sp. DG1229]|uniref:M24 family metallopeptidase n=1 Tax=Labrenzia sp. DG1229 TaxID=681847 RepID=UPI00155DDD3D|nr:Xaa-Pro peptidase family protein [Labrenzia sp. DG1229]